MYNIFTYEFLLLDLISSLIGIFISIALLQSGIDKVLDRKGNLSWLTDHFSNSILKNNVSLLLLTITIMELLSGFLLLLGALFNIPYITLGGLALIVNIEVFRRLWILKDN